jgi:hypothetical protein
LTQVAADLSALCADLDRLQRLFALAGDKRREPMLTGIVQRLWVPEQRLSALEELKQCFGGMGSLNDIIFCEANRNIPSGYKAEAATIELDLLLDNIFRGASLFGASAGERTEWMRRERESRFPLRVLNAFRGQL